MGSGRVFEQGDRICVAFSFDTAISARLKKLGGKWSGELGAWHVPRSITNFERLLKELPPSFTYTRSILEWAKGVSGDTVEVISERPLEVAPMKSPVSVPTAAPGAAGILAKYDGVLKLPLKNFQKEDLHRIVEGGGRALVAWDMGTGKTALALAYAEHTRSKTLVVTINSMKYVWGGTMESDGADGEIRKFTSRRPFVIKPGMPVDKIDATADYVVINYDSLEKYAPALEKMGFQLLVLDESHAIKNMQSNRTQAVHKHLGRIPHALLLTGTPIENRPIEFYSQLELLHRGQWGSYDDFGTRYGGPTTVDTYMPISKAMGYRIGAHLLGKGASGFVRFPAVLGCVSCATKLKIAKPSRYTCPKCGQVMVMNGRGRIRKMVPRTVYNGVSNLDELKERIKGVMVRRRKADVLTELPPKRRTSIPVELPPAARKEINVAFKTYAKEIVDEAKKKALAADSAKEREDALAYVDDFMSAKSMVKLGFVRRMLVDYKLPAIAEFINDKLENTDRCAVVFTQFPEVAAQLYEYYKDCAVTINADVDPKDRLKICQQFNNDQKMRLAIVTAKTGGTGLTLTKADMSIFCDPLWTRSAHNQAEDRAHRMGLDSDEFDVFNFIAKDTVDVELEMLVGVKGDIADKVLSDGAEDKTTQEIEQRLDYVRRKVAERVGLEDGAAMARGGM